MEHIQIRNVMKKQITTFLIAVLLIFPLFAQELTTPTTLYGCFEYFDEVFTEEEKTKIKSFESPYSFCSQNFFVGRNDYLSKTAAYREGKLNFRWKNRELWSNTIPEGYPGIHFEDYPDMIYRSYYYLLKYGDCRWDFILKAYSPSTYHREYEDTGIIRTIYPDNIDNADLQKTYYYSCTYYKEKVLDTILFFKNDLNETYIYSFAYSWRKIPEKDFDELIKTDNYVFFISYFDELFKDSPFIGGL